MLVFLFFLCPIPWRPRPAQVIEALDFSCLTCLTCKKKLLQIICMACVFQSSNQLTGRRQGSRCKKSHSLPMLRQLSDITLATSKGAMQKSQLAYSSVHYKIVTQITKSHTKENHIVKYHRLVLQQTSSGQRTKST